MSVEHIAIAISSLWSVCSLLTLKLSIASSKATRPKREPTALATLESLKFLLLRFTLIEIFAIRNSKYKHGLLLSIALIAFINIFSPPFIIFWGWALGTIPALLVFIPSDIKASRSGTQEESKPNQHAKAFLYGSYTITTISCSAASALYLYYISIPKSNTILLSFGVNIAVDQLIVRPLLCLIGSPILSKSQQFHIWAESCLYQQSAVRVAVDTGCAASSPPKANRSLSPSKVPKCLFFQVKQLALEPKSNLTPRNDQDSVADLIGYNGRAFKNPFQTPVRKTRSRMSNNTDSSLDVIEVMGPVDHKLKQSPPKQEQNDRSNLKVQILEAIEVKETAKEHDMSLGSIPVPSSSKIIEQQMDPNDISGTGAHIMNIKQKNSGRTSGMETFRLDEPSKEPTKQIIQEQHQDNLQNVEERKEITIIDQVQNQPANTSHISIKQSNNQHSHVNQQQFNQSSIENIIIEDASHIQNNQAWLEAANKKDEQQWQNPFLGIPQDITAIQTKRTSVIKERLINHDSNDDQNSSYSDEDPGVKEYLEEFHKSRTLDPGMRLQINKEYRPSVQFSEYAGQQLEEVDLNSPTKNIKIHISPKKKDQPSPNPISRPKKKKNKRDIKQLMKLNGNSPYLQYLPNMLNKQIQQHNKRSQPINPHKTRTESKSKTTRPPLPLKCSIIQVDSNLQNKSPDDMF